MQLQQVDPEEEEIVSDEQRVEQGGFVAEDEEPGFSGIPASHQHLSPTGRQGSDLLAAKQTRQATPPRPRLGEHGHTQVSNSQLLHTGDLTGATQRRFRDAASPEAATIGLAAARLAAQIQENESQLAQEIEQQVSWDKGQLTTFATAFAKLEADKIEFAKLEEIAAQQLADEQQRKIAQCDFAGQQRQAPAHIESHNVPASRLREDGSGTPPPPPLLRNDINSAELRSSSSDRAARRMLSPSLDPDVRDAQLRKYDEAIKRIRNSPMNSPTKSY